MDAILAMVDLSDPGRFPFSLGIALCPPGLSAETFLALSNSGDFDIFFSSPGFFLFLWKSFPV